MQRGFTLVEVLVSIFIITVGAGGAFSLVQQTLNFTTNAALQLEASYLAQEGMEIVRNIRDANLLKIYKSLGGTWQDGLAFCSAGCQADYTQSSLNAYEDTLLQLSNGTYSYTVGANSIFKRKITVTQEGDNTIKVLTEVMWEERGRSHVVKAATELYNWLPLAP
ncbi:MAG: prepilin-type N-terminal cleavage/methylation domain-containing protein [bacterium]|nr:prepilin-type N-terminal cleavage/methylation domain-containing protein [bacterium]